MIFVAHRVNTTEELAKVPTDYGVECDVRDRGDQLVLRHDPFIPTDGKCELLEDYLKAFRHKLLIANIKSEGIEFRVIELLKKYKVNDYFFLDSSFPMMIKLAALGEKNQAVRYSDYESIKTVTAMSGKANWVWLDCFNEYPGTHVETLHRLGYRVCVVSPELQGHKDGFSHPDAFFLRLKADAVCSKLPNASFWLNKTSTE